MAWSPFIGSGPSADGPSRNDARVFSLPDAAMSLPKAVRGVATVSRIISSTFARFRYRVLTVCCIKHAGSYDRIPMKSRLPVLALVGALSFSGAAGAQQSGTADEAKALLARAAAAVKSDKPSALARFDDPRGGFKDRDLYVFCFDRRYGTILAGQPRTKGKDIRTFKDPSGKAFGQEMFANVNDSDFIIVDYRFPKPNSDVPVDKESFVEGLGDVACGVGYYKTSAPGDLSRTARKQHACAVVMGLPQSGALYNTCIRILDDTLFELDKAQLISIEQNACARLGFRPGTPSFAACVANGPGF